MAECPTCEQIKNTMNSTMMQLPYYRVAALFPALHPVPGVLLPTAVPFKGEHHLCAQTQL